MISAGGSTLKTKEGLVESEYLKVTYYYTDPESSVPYFSGPARILCDFVELHRAVAFHLTLPQPHLHRNQNRRIPIPPNKRILPTHTPRILQISPFAQEILMCQNFGKFARDSAVHVFHDAEIGREEDVEVALLDL